MYFFLLISFNLPLVAMLNMYFAMYFQALDEMRITHPYNSPIPDFAI